MRRRNRWMIGLLIIVSLLIAACGRVPVSSEHVVAAEVQTVEGSDFKRLVLTDQAAQRLDIQTTAIQEEEVTRTRTIGGEVVAGETADAPYVRVLLTASELDAIDRSQSALILPLVNDGGEAGWAAQEVDATAGNAQTDPELALLYAVDSPAGSLTVGERVYVQLTLNGSGTQRIVIPYSSVFYDSHGETWVYTNPEPLVFVRGGINVDYIDGDRAILVEGPALGTEIVTVGVTELYGVEFGIGK